MDIKEFFFALLGDWVALMSGAASVALTILGIVRKWEIIPRWAFWVAAVVCFFAASARVWTTEHRKYLSELENNTPQLKGDILVVSVGWMDQFGPNVAMILPTLKVSNLGMPSVVEDWRLYVQIPGKPVKEALTLYLPSGTITMPLTNNPNAKQTFSGQDYLPPKTATEPIPKGGARIGLLLFRLLDTDYRLVKSIGTIYTVKFRDVKGKQYSAEHILQGSFGDTPIYVPGLSRPDDGTTTNQHLP